MFGVLSERLQSVIEKLGRKRIIDEKTLEEGLKEIRLLLLEADVNYKVAKSIVSRIKEKAIGARLPSGITPFRVLVGIIYDELVNVLGGSSSELNLSGKPSSILLIGLQGSGKTTTSAKLANYLKKQGKKVLLTSCDIYRPAAVVQLEKLAKKVGVDFFFVEKDPVDIAKLSLERAREGDYDVLIVDTAGRLHIDEEMLEEARKIKEAINPQEVLFVIDAMMGQEAVNVATAFDEKVGMTGVVLTKIDSDARGGTALSVKEVTGKPIKFVGTGEHIDDFSLFHPERMASRILGMGDVATLAEKAQEIISEKEALSFQEKLLSGQFTLEDLRKQLKLIQKLGPLKQIASMIPGFGTHKAMKQLEKMLDDKRLKRMIAILDSMTPEERKNHTIINASRKRRIARGSGTSVKDVDNLLRQFAQMRMAVKQMKKLQKKLSKKGINFQDLFKF
jgi:signal recognition particle subunit SRP54